MLIYTSKSKVICIGRNYVEHIHELNNQIPTSPVIFIKPNTAISNHINLPKNRNQLHYEAEIVFAFDKNGSIKAVGLGLDLTDRNLQSELKSKGLPWELAKSFDGSAVLSEFVEMSNLDITKLSFKAYKNGNLIQSGDYKQMIYKPDLIIDFLAKNSISIKENDFLMTGTPKGVGVIEQGDIFEIELFCENKRILITKFK